MLARMDLALAFEDAEPFRLTVDQYGDLMDQGVFEDGARIELLEGVIVRMNAQTAAHAIVANMLGRRLSDRLEEIGSTMVALIGPTVAMPPRNAPDPDIVVGHVPADGRFFAVAAVALLVEVSRTTFRKDSKFKRDIYAAAGVPEYWVVDVNKTEVHRFAHPINGVYTAEPPVPLAGELRSLTMPDLIVDGSGIL